MFFCFSYILIIMLAYYSFCLNSCFLYKHRRRYQWWHIRSVRLIYVL